MRTNPRSLFLMLTVLLVALCCPALLAQTADADQAKALLQQGVKEYEDLRFQDAKDTLLKVDASRLTDVQRSQLQSLLTKTDVAIRGQRSAMEAYNGANEALKNNDLSAAREGFAMAAASPSLPPQTRQDARAQLAAVDMRIKAARAAQPVQPPAPLAEHTPADQPAEASQAPAEAAPNAAEAVARPAVAEGVTAPAEAQPPAAEETAPLAAEPPAPMAEETSPLAAEPTADGMTQASASTESALSAGRQPPAQEGELSGQTGPTNIVPMPEQMAAKEPPPAAAEQAPAEAPAADTRVQEMICAGDQALADNRPEQAVQCYQQALDLDPANAQACQQLQLAQSCLGTGAETDILSRAERNRIIARQAAIVNFQKEMCAARRTPWRAHRARRNSQPPPTRCRPPARAWRETGRCCRPASIARCWTPSVASGRRSSWPGRPGSSNWPSSSASSCADPRRA